VAAFVTVDMSPRPTGRLVARIEVVKKCGDRYLRSHAERMGGLRLLRSQDHGERPVELKPYRTAGNISAVFYSFLTRLRIIRTTAHPLAIAQTVAMMGGSRGLTLTANRHGPPGGGKSE